MIITCNGLDENSTRLIAIPEFDEATVKKTSRLLENRKNRKAYKVVNCDCGLTYDDKVLKTTYPHNPKESK